MAKALVQKMVVHEGADVSPLLPMHVALTTPEGDDWHGSADVANGSITSEKLADGAVEADKVKDGAITAQKLASGVVPTELPPIDGSVTTEKVSDGAITKAKLGPDVDIPKAYTLTAATTEKLGGVKKASAVTAVASADATNAAADAVTKDEFNKVVAVANETKKQLNDLLSKLKSAGITA